MIGLPYLAQTWALMNLHPAPPNDCRAHARISYGGSTRIVIAQAPMSLALQWWRNISFVRPPPRLPSFPTSISYDPDRSSHGRGRAGLARLRMRQVVDVRTICLDIVRR
jgi:hypothetical protein